LFFGYYGVIKCPVAERIHQAKKKARFPNLKKQMKMEILAELNLSMFRTKLFCVGSS